MAIIAHAVGLLREDCENQSAAPTPTAAKAAAPALLPPNDMFTGDCGFVEDGSENLS